MIEKKKTKVYIYIHVSTAMQIDGYSLDARRTRMRAFAEFNDYEVTVTPHKGAAQTLMTARQGNPRSLNV